MHLVAPAPIPSPHAAARLTSPNSPFFTGSLPDVLENLLCSIREHGVAGAQFALVTVRGATDLSYVLGPVDDSDERDGTTCSPQGAEESDESEWEDLDESDGKWTPLRVRPAPPSPRSPFANGTSPSFNVPNLPLAHILPTSPPRPLDPHAAAFVPWRPYRHTHPRPRVPAPTFFYSDSASSKSLVLTYPSPAPHFVPPQPPTPTRTLWLSGLPACTSHGSLARFIARATALRNLLWTELHEQSDETKMAFVRFKRGVDADDVASALDGLKVKDCVVTVLRARNQRFVPARMRRRERDVGVWATGWRRQ